MALILNIFNGQNYFENKFPSVYGTIMLPNTDVYVSFIIILTITKFCEPLMQNISKKKQLDFSHILNMVI